MAVYLKQAWPLATLLLLATAFARAQNQVACTELNAPATPAYDFTEELTRWGSKNNYGIANGLRQVREISVNTLPIFDENNPRENNWLFRWANAIHFTTKPKVITDQLLFKPEQWVNDSMLAESERILRDRHYVGDSRIRVLRQCGAAVDLEVVSREVWTLTPEASFKSTGGSTSASLGMRDSNILGSGQFLEFKYKHNQERNSYDLNYRNPNIGGSHAYFNSEVASTSDGHHYMAEVAQPFYSLADKHSWRVLWESTEEILTQYSFGQDVSSLNHTMKSADLSYGISDGLVNGSVKRFSAGVHLSQQQWQPGLVLPPPPAFHPQLDLYYPYLQYDYIEDNYVTGFNIGQIRRTEDLQVGLHLRSRVGYAGNEGGNLMLDGELGSTLLYRPGKLLQVATSWNARWNRDRSRFEDTEVKSSLDYHQEHNDHRNLFLSLVATKVVNLNNGKQLELGGSNGLRGYDTHFLNGTGSVQFTAEERYFTNYHFLQLARVGFAAFYDAGRMFGNVDPAAGRFYQDVGVGLRLAPSRSESGQLVHIDIAWPLHANAPGVSGYQLAVQVSNSF